MKSGTIHTFGHDAYSVFVDPVSGQHTATPRRGHPNLICTLYGRHDCFGYACAFKNYPLYDATTKVAVNGHGYKTDIDIVVLAGSYGLIYGRRILEIHFVYQIAYAVYLL
jgi:hypothetical protein